MSKKNSPTPTIRSSAAEYLTFVAASAEGGVEAIYANEDVWLSQKMLGVLYDVETHTINYHLKKIFTDSELEEDAVIRNFRITAADGKSYSTRLNSVRRTCHNFGYGVGDDMDDLIAEYGIDDRT